MFMVLRPLLFKRSFWLAGGACLALLLCLSLTLGQVMAIARGYETADTGLQTGMVAALSTEGAATVERATQNNVKRVVGVVTTFDTSSVTIASGQTKILVESEGQVEAYISDLNGQVKQGDQLIMSPLKGILMKASENNTSSVLAIAAQNVEPTAESLTYTAEKDGSQKETKITKATVNLNVQGSNGGSGVGSDSPLAKLGQAIVGKNVGEARVLAALLVFIIVLIAEGGIIYGAVTSAITALGRNPMAQKVIRREIAQVILVAIGVLLVGLAAVYGILWL